MKRSLGILSIALLLGVSACSDEKTETGKSEPSSPTQSAPQTQTTPTGNKPAAPPQKTAASTETVTNNACLSAVGSETGEANLAILSNEFSEANTLVMIGVGANRAPWRCLVSNDAQVQEIMFTGDDSAGAPAPAGGMGGSDVSGAAVDAYLSAVSGETGNGDVAILGTEFSEANSLVTVGVGPDRAAWRCLVSNDAQVLEVMSQSDEGAL